MIDYVRINGVDFTVRGYARKADGMHLNIRLGDDQTPDDVINAVKAGNDPLEFYNDDGTIAAVFEGFTFLDRYSVLYRYEFGIDDFGMAFQAVIAKPVADANDITNLQMAVAELAGMIVGENSNG